MIASIQIEGARIAAATSFEFKDQCRAVPTARWEPNRLRWSYSPTPWVAKSLVETLGARATQIGSAFKVSDQVRDLAAAAIDVREIWRESEAAEISKNPNTRFPPWRHQFNGSSLFRRLVSAYLAFDMGTGKTKTTIDGLLDLYQDADYLLALIACPAAVVSVWEGEVAKHVLDPGIFLVSAIQGKSVKARALHAAETLRRAVAEGKIGLVVTNYESFVLDGSPMLELCALTPWDVVVPDEAHRLSTPGSKTTLAFTNKIGPRAKRRFALSGTPLRNSPLDVYAQCKFLDPGIFGSSSSVFLNNYAVLDQWGAVVGTKNEADLAERFAMIAMRVDKRQVLDLPPVSEFERRFKLSAEAQKIYDKFEEDLAYEFEDGRVASAANSLVKLLRLAQLSSGYLPATDLESGVEAIKRIDGGKASELAEVLDEIGPKEPVAVFCRFRHDLDEVKTVAKAAGRDYLELSGRGKDLAEWQQRTGGEVLGVQCQSGGVGVDLTRSAYAVFYSIGYSLSDYDQMKARLDRPGQTRPVTLLRILATGTVDETIYGAIGKKGNVVEAVLDRLRSVRAKGKK